MSNEVSIAAGLIEECLAEGYQTPHLVKVISGPGPEARIVGVRWEDGKVVLEYDRPVRDVVLQSLHAAP